MLLLTMMTSVTLMIEKMHDNEEEEDGVGD